MTSGYVYLIGAGCGPADLITLRGMERLGRCDAVVYDDLIDPRLLELAPAGAQRIYMGKRQGRHSAPQSEINEKLISLAREGKRVARLKGGTPSSLAGAARRFWPSRPPASPMRRFPASPPPSPFPPWRASRSPTGGPAGASTSSPDTPPTPRTACLPSWTIWPGWTAPWSFSWD